MKLALSRLVIWPRDEGKPYRVVSFWEEGINLVTGGNRSGKSAIIKIMDYCLGSKSCNIPKLGPIRRSSSWYGVVVNTGEGYKLLARRDPDQQESTDDYMLLETAQPTIPDRPSKNTNRDSIKNLLARLAGLPQVDVDFEQTGSGFKARASFGDMTAFMFQPQSLVANDSVLFYKTEEEEHARKLREVFPLVLGAVDAETMVTQHRLAEVRRVLERRRRQLEVLRGALADYAGEIRGRFMAAVELGLIRSDFSRLEDADLVGLVTRLRELERTWKTGEGTAGTPAPEKAGFRLAAMRARELEAAERIASLKLRLVHIRELSQARHLSKDALSRERDRLAAASWLSQELTRTSSCPFCGNENHSASAELDAVLRRVQDIEAQWRGIGHVPPMLDAQELEIQKALAQETEDLRQCRAEKAQLEQRSADAIRSQQEQAIFVGGLTEFFRLQGTIGDDAELAAEIKELEEEEQRLSDSVDAAAVEQRKEDALLFISQYAQHYGKIVELEHSGELLKLDTKALTIRVVNDRGVSASMRQIGSGANHLGYHVAMLLALHEFFLQRGLPYVPSLLALDQPSQTQFPDDVDEDAEVEELVAVHRAFEALNSAVERTKGQLQVIVSEHASKSVSSDIPHLRIVEKWRWGRKLIPWHWDTEALDGMRGKRADGAMEDLKQSILVPKLPAMLELAAGQQILDVRIQKAVFEDRSIAFEAEVTIADSKTEELSPRGLAVRGHVLRDLSVAVTRSTGTG